MKVIKRVKKPFQEKSSYLIEERLVSTRICVVGRLMGDST